LADKKTCSPTSPSTSSAKPRTHDTEAAVMNTTSSHSSPTDVIDVAPYVVDAATRLTDRVPEVASAIAAMVRDEIDELREASSPELLSAGAESNVTTVLQALRCGIAVERVQAPAAALEHARRLARHGVPVNALVRAYRLGQQHMTEQVFEQLQTMDMPARLALTVMEAITATLFSYIDRVCEQVVDVYEKEREQWLATHNSIRVSRVREVLAARLPIDADAVSTAIGCPLRWHHLALLMWYPAAVEADQLARLQGLVRSLGTAANAAASPLFISTDRTSGWVWLPYRSAPPPDVVDSVRRLLLARPDPPNVAVGLPAAGPAGFRLSHQRAQAARDVVTARRDHTPALVTATDPGLSAAALLGGNVETARDWVTDVLAVRRR
jgi:GGDEF-like domain